MNLPLGFGKIDWSDWVRGIVAAFISGGAAAVTSGVTVNMLDPDRYNIHTGSFYVLILAMFAANGTLNMMAFLREKPLPELKTVVSTVETTRTPGIPTTTVVTVKETSIEPKEPKP